MIIKDFIIIKRNIRQEHVGPIRVRSFICIPIGRGKVVYMERTCAAANHTRYKHPELNNLNIHALIYKSYAYNISSIISQIV